MQTRLTSVFLFVYFQEDFHDYVKERLKSGFSQQNSDAENRFTEEKIIADMIDQLTATPIFQ